jgi:hypothetical protein
MTDNDSQLDHPYREFKSTPEWIALDRAIGELVENRDLTETTSRKYIVGYLCKALANETFEIGAKEGEK